MPNFANFSVAAGVLVLFAYPLAAQSNSSPLYADGTLITLQSDTGLYAARCRNCLQGATYEDNISIHVTDPTLPYARFRVTNLRGCLCRP